MIYPSWRDWVFSLKTFAAAMLALYLALKFELPRPYWAMATVYIVSNPFMGATRSKALYRVLGTLLGASAAVLLVPPFSQMPLLLSLLISLWTGALLYCAISERGARNYVFMLAAYTLPFIALPSVYHPAGVFDLAVSRAEEITLGILCASLINSVILPAPLSAALGERTLGWFGDAARFSGEALAGRIASRDMSQLRQRLALTTNGFEFLLSQLAYDHSSPVILARSEALRNRMALLLPIVSSLGDLLLAQRARGRVGSPAFDALLADTAAWMRQPPGETSAADAQALRARIAALEPSAQARRAWEGTLLSAALWRLGQTLDAWDDCTTLWQIIAHGREAAWQPRLRHWRSGQPVRFADRGMTLFSAASAMLATFTLSAIWIFSGWQEGGAAVSLAAVACCFYASLDEPAPQVFGFLLWTCASVLLAGLYLFVILPNVQDFAMLVLLFAVPFIALGLFIPRPRYTSATMLTAVLTATFLSIQSTYDANFLTFLNGNLAGPAGLVFALVWTRVVRPFGIEVAIARLQRSSWRDIAAATRPGAENPRRLAARMLDRLMQLLQRLDAGEGPVHPSLDSFRDLRIGFNTLDLRRAQARVPPDLQRALEGVFDGVRAHFLQCAAARTRRAVSSDLLERIDAGLAQAGALPSSRTVREVQHALAGIRLSLALSAQDAAQTLGGTLEGAQS